MKKPPKFFVSMAFHFKRDKISFVLAVGNVFWPVTAVFYGSFNGGYH